MGSSSDRTIVSKSLYCPEDLEAIFRYAFQSIGNETVFEIHSLRAGTLAASDSTTIQNAKFLPPKHLWLFSVRIRIVRFSWAVYSLRPKGLLSIRWLEKQVIPTVKSTRQESYLDLISYAWVALRFSQITNGNFQTKQRFLRPNWMS